MASKKYILAAALIVLIQTVGLAQTDWGWDWKDTSKVSVKNMPQNNEFLNNQYPYPAKPRNQWELGIGLGTGNVIGDVTGKLGFGANITLRKALSNVFSIRAGYEGILASSALKGTPPAARPIGSRGYKNQTHMLGFDVIASLNSISHYRGNPKADIYLLAGYSFIAANVQFKDIDPNGSVRYTPGINSARWPGSSDGLIGRSGDFGFWHGLNAGFGASFKLSKKVNIGIEQKFTMIAFGKYDYLDGYAAGNNADFYSLTTARLNINIGNTAKRVEPLWWLNPNNFVYSELNSPKHMKMPKVVLPDADGDGVTDQFDMEPNTPKGAPVDSHCISKDTDGDGVPDYKDKEVLTPKNCFPVNNDGIGSCPEPACCKEIKDMMANMQPKAAECNIGNLPSIQFKKNAKLSKDAEAALASAAAKINANPACKVKVIGYGTSSKAAQQMSWERVNAVIHYLVEKQGVSENRLLFVFGQEGDANTIDLQGTTEEGPNTVPAPHPNLRSRN
jgi:OmpA-OmpF porin, OOP family